MLLQRLKLIISIAFIGVMLLLALPEFSVTFAGRTATFPSVGFSTIGIPEDYPSFRQGSDIFPVTRFITDVAVEGETTVEKAEKLHTILDSIQERRDYAGLQDITIYARYNDTQFQLLFEMPDRFEQPEQYVSLLTTPGNITFEYLTFGEENQIGQVPLNFDVQDVTQVEFSNNIEYTVLANSAQQGTIEQRYNQGLNNLTLSFDEDIAPELQTIPNFENYVQQIQTGQPYLVSMQVDSAASFQLIRNDANDNSLRALPTAQTAPQQIHFARIVQSLFQEEAPLNTTMTIQENTEHVIPPYNAEGGSFISGMFILGMAFVMVYLYTQFGVRRALVGTIAISSVQLTTITLLKLAQIPLSSGLIIGFIVITIIALFAFIDLQNQDEENTLFTRINTYTTTAFVMLVSLYVLSLIPLTLGGFSATLSTILVGLLALCFVLYFVYYVFIDIFIKQSISLPRIILGT